MTTEPPHPGQAVRHDCLEPFGLTVTEGAGCLPSGSQQPGQRKAGISAEMALRLSKAFGGTPDTWLHLQMAYDLAQARKREPAIRVRTFADVRRQQPPRLL
ncbi:MAG: HigA family addiction module antidote protein [Caulobacteraceae bacterium]|nr:HigA family addiction module antidote protein [Caulobacteraceae bacterium]